MGQPIANQSQTLADELAEARTELRNARALLDSKTHEADSLHIQIDNYRSYVERMDRCKSDLTDALSTIGAMMDVLRPLAAPAYAELGSPLDVARHIASRLTTDPEPDIDTVPLADLLEAVGTYLEHDQAVTIRGSFEAVRHVQIHAIGLTFAVETHEASESLTKLQELGGCLVVEAAR